MNVTLPDSLRPWVESQAAMAGHSSVDGYLEAMLVEQRNRMRREIDRLLLEGLESGEPEEVNEQFWKERRQEAKEIVQKLAKKNA
jgi:antitoxin ParD1/3/4